MLLLISRWLCPLISSSDREYNIWILLFKKYTKWMENIQWSMLCYIVLRSFITDIFLLDLLCTYTPPAMKNMESFQTIYIKICLCILCTGKWLKWKNISFSRLISLSTFICARGFSMRAKLYFIISYIMTSCIVKCTRTLMSE